MALLRAAGLCRLALRTQWAAARLLGSSAGGGEPPDAEDKQGRRFALEALRRERALRPPSDRPPRVPPLRQPRVTSELGKSTDWTVRFNAKIQACASVEAVLDLVTPQLERLSYVNVSTALLTISRRAARGPTAWLRVDTRFTQLLASAARVIERMEPRNLSNSLYACGQLGVTPPADWLQRFWHASALKLDDFNPQELSNTLYACGQLGVTPPADWLQRYWTASALKLGESTPQQLSNTLYACGQLGIVPSADWMEHYWQVSASKMDEFKPQDFSNTLYACSKLATVPPVDWLERYWKASASKLGEFKPQELNNTVLSCGLLNTRPPSDWLQRFSSACERALPGMDQQGLANTALALATLALWELSLWRSLWERLCGSLPRDIAGWSAKDRLAAQQLYQVYQTAAVERPGLLPSPNPELLAAARKSWIDGTVDTASKLHADVSACLTRMGVAHVNERWCDKAERSIDIAIEGATPVAVEVDGPYHFLQDGRQDGSTLLRNRMLKAHGWRVVVVDYRDWRSQRTEAQREAYLRSLLSSALP